MAVFGGLDPDRPGRAGAILDHDRLSEHFAEAHADEAAHGVDRAAGRVRHDQPDRPGRIVLSDRRRRGERERECESGVAYQFHHALPWRNRDVRSASASRSQSRVWTPVCGAHWSMRVGGHSSRPACRPGTRPADTSVVHSGLAPNGNQIGEYPTYGSRPREARIIAVGAASRSTPRTARRDRTPNPAAVGVRRGGFQST